MASFEIDFGPIGQIANTYRNAQNQRQTQDWLQQQGLPGNLPLAQLALLNQRDARDFAFREQEAKRSQGNTDRAFALQKQLGTEKPQVVWQDDPDGGGGKVPYLVQPMGKGVTRLAVEGDTAAGQPRNPFAIPGKPTEAQTKDALFAGRLFEAEQILRKPESVAAAVTPSQHVIGGIASRGGLHGMAANAFLNKDYQNYDQAKRNFINAVLRKESGAVISPEEFLNAEKQYFPQPNDDPERIEQKRQNRAAAIRGITGGAGSSFRPDFIFDDKGEIVANPAPKRGEAKQPPANPNAWKNTATITAARSNPQATIAEAQQAIQGGADPNAVAQRLRQIGIDPAPLLGNTGFAGPSVR